MNTAKLRTMTRVISQKLLLPGPVPVTIFVVLFYLGAMYSFPLALVILIGTSVVGWLAMIGVCLIIPPPPRIAERSALRQRLSWLIKTLWATTVFALAAVYSAAISYDLTKAMEAGRDPMTVVRDGVTLPLSLVVVLCGFYASISCAIDLWRIGPTIRHQAVDTLAHALTGGHDGTPVRYLKAWLTWLTEGPPSFYFGYVLVPVLAIIISFGL